MAELSSIAPAENQAQAGAAGPAADVECPSTDPSVFPAPTEVGSPFRERPSAPQPAIAPSGSSTFSFLQPPQLPAEIGTWAHYRVLKVLGQGGMGIVFLAEDTRLRREVALKVMRPELAHDPVARERFMREARATAAVRSDHIVAIHEVGVVRELPYLATEFLHGKSLDLCLQTEPRPGLPAVIDLAVQIAAGLDAAHRCGLVHRDVKPANIWVEDPTRRVKLLDFGLARAIDPDGCLTQCGTIVGTPAYMAPEQADGKPVDPRCDLFSLGCVLYEMIAGKRPFEGASTVAFLKATALKDPTPLARVVPDVPAALADLVMQLLAKDPERRPPSAAAVIDELEAIAAESGLAPHRVARARAPAPPVSDQKRSRFLPPVTVTVLAGVLIFAVLAVLAAHRIKTLNADQPGGPAPDETAQSERADAVQGVSESEIVLGMSAPFSGPSRQLGTELEIGIQAYFRHVNQAGGVAGRQLRLIALDDGYQPEHALANIKELDETHRVFAILGNVGTPTAQKTLPYALSRNLLFIGAFTGAPLLRKDPPDRYVFNYRASYKEETAAIVKYLVKIRGVGAEQIAVFAQTDGYGDAGFHGVAKTLRDYGRKEEAILRVGYERNSSDVTAAVQEILRHKEIRAVVMVATYRPAAAFIQQVRDVRKDLIFTNVSFVGSDALAAELRQLGPAYAPGVIVTQVVPHPASYSSAVLRYRELLHQAYPNQKPSFVSLEGYLDAVLLVEGLRRAGRDLTTETLVDALETVRDFDVGLGAPLHYGPSEHQASHKVWGAVLDASGTYQTLELE